MFAVPRTHPEYDIPVDIHSMVEAEEYLTREGRFLCMFGAMLPVTKSGVPPLAKLLARDIMALGMVSHNPIKLLIHSPGGFVDAGLWLYDVIKSSPAPIWTIASQAGSMAAYILAAGEPGHRYVYPNASIMIHPMELTGISGDVRQMRARSIESERVSRRLSELLVECGSTYTLEDLMELTESEIWWTAEEAIGAGLADKIVERGDF